MTPGNDKGQDTVEHHPKHWHVGDNGLPHEGSRLMDGHNRSHGLPEHHILLSVCTTKVIPYPNSFHGPGPEGLQVKPLETREVVSDLVVRRTNKKEK